MALTPDHSARARRRLPPAITSRRVGELLDAISLSDAAERDAALGATAKRDLDQAWSRTADAPPIPMVPFTEDEEGKPLDGDLLCGFVAYIEASSRRNAHAVTGWIVGGYLAPVSGEILIRQLELQPLDDETAPVTGTVLRAIHPDAIVARAVAQLRDLPSALNVLDRHGLHVPSSDAKRRALEAAGAAAEHERRRGRAGYPEGHYRQVALDYLELQDSGVVRGIRTRLAERYGVSTSMIADWVHRAYELQFLGPGRRGKAGREAGPRLHGEDNAPPPHAGAREVVQATPPRR
jgi:hypothetical protein